MKKPTDRQLRDTKWWEDNMPKAADALLSFYAIGYCTWVKSTIYDGKETWVCILTGGHYFKCRDDFDVIYRPTPSDINRCKVLSRNGDIICSDATITYQGNGVGCYINNDNGNEYSLSHYDYLFKPIQNCGERKPMSRDDGFKAIMSDHQFDNISNKQIGLILDTLGYKERET